MGGMVYCVTTLTAHPDKAVLQLATLQVISELLLHILEQEPIFRGKLDQNPRVMLFYNLIEQNLFGTVARIPRRDFVAA